MKKVITRIIPLFLLLITHLTNAQVLFNENFDSYPTGHLNAIYDNTTPGQGGWLVSRDPSSAATAMVSPETGKGNVVVCTSVASSSTNGVSFMQDYNIINTLWNNRTVGNNVLKFEYEFYGMGKFNSTGNVISQGQTLINTIFLSGLNQIRATYWDSTFKTTILKNYSSADPFPENMWIKSEIFVDYNTKKIYFYIPTLNLYTTGAFSHNRIPDNLDLTISNLNTTSVVKIDNIKLTALNTVPPEVIALSVNQQLATKFNLYPNPATNVVNITNEENMQVNQIAVYTLAGKQVSTQTYNNQTEIQLNVENLASGTYLLYIQTAQGIAVKKLVKK